MPKISQAFSSIEVTLPSYPDSNVEVKTNVTVSELIDAEKIDSTFEKSVFLASKLILKWNFQDENGADLPVSKENLIQLPASDLEFILETITPFLQKKTPSEKTS